MGWAQAQPDGIGIINIDINALEGIIDVNSMLPTARTFLAGRATPYRVEEVSDAE